MSRLVRSLSLILLTVCLTVCSLTSVLASNDYVTFSKSYFWYATNVNSSWISGVLTSTSGVVSDGEGSYYSTIVAGSHSSVAMRKLRCIFVTSSTFNADDFTYSASCLMSSSASSYPTIASIVCSTGYYESGSFTALFDSRSSSLSVNSTGNEGVSTGSITSSGACNAFVVDVVFESSYAFSSSSTGTTFTISLEYVSEELKALEDIKSQNEEAETTRKGILATLKEVGENIIELPAKLVNLLIEGLKTLFIPSDDFFDSVVEELQETFSESLGFLWYPFELVSDFVDIWSSAGSGGISFDGWSFNGMTVLPAFTLNVNDFSFYATIKQYLYLIGDILISFGVIRLAVRQLDNILNGGKSDDN